MAFVLIAARLCYLLGIFDVLTFAVYRRGIKIFYEKCNN